MNTAAVTSFARNVWSDLKERRLWPLALVLLLGLVAVPVLLSKSSSAPSTPVGTPVANASGIPAVSVQTSQGRPNVRGAGRDPFSQSGAGSRSGTTTTVPVSGASGTTGGAASSTGTSTSTSATAGSSASGGSTPASVASGPAPAGGAPPPPVPENPSPVPAGLSATQSYDVAISITNSSGGLNRIDPVERLSLLPSDQQPRAVELGVLQGGHRVLFAVAPGTVLRGPGICVPGRVDCEILSLAENQIESLSTSATSAPIAMFAVTGISATNHSSSGAAQQARRAESAAGRQELSSLSVPALQLFPYSVGAGAVVDLRNLTVGEVNGAEVQAPDAASDSAYGSSAQPSSTSSPPPVLSANLTLLPQGFQAVLRDGVALRLTTNESADGLARITIARAAAKRAGIKLGRQPVVSIGRGTLSGIKHGTVRLRLALSRATAAKLAQLRHVTLTIHLILTARGGRLSLDAAGRY